MRDIILRDKNLRPNSKRAAKLRENTVMFDEMTPHLVSRLRRFTRLPILCKPNAGMPVIDEKGAAQYDMGPEPFAHVIAACRQNGASLLGGCCGTEPQHIAAAAAAMGM